MNDNYTTSPVSFPQALTLLFVALKLTHVIDWSWWWVASPMIYSVVVYLLLVLLEGVVKGGK